MPDAVVDFAGDLSVVLVALGLIGAAVRWLWHIGRKLDRANEALDNLPAIIRAEVEDHVAGYHEPPPPSIPTWVQPQPNGIPPSGRRPPPRHRR
jgi:hypothetical protein